MIAQSHSHLGIFEDGYANYTRAVWKAWGSELELKRHKRNGDDR